MALDTYTNLKTAIAAWLNRSDLTTPIVDFITLCEARLKREEDVYEGRYLDLTVSSARTALPTGFKEPTDLSHVGGTYYGPLEVVNTDRIHALRDGSTGPPTHAAFQEDGQYLLVSPEPDTTYVLKLSYKHGIDVLGSSQATNWVLTNHPDLYLFGSLVESAPYLKDDGRVPLWESKFTAALAKLRIQKDRARFGGKLVARPLRALGE